LVSLPLGFCDRWKIRAKVIVKDAIKPYSNAGRKGSYFCVRLQDETGEIRGVAFNDVGRRLAEHIEIGKVRGHVEVLGTRLS